MAGCLCGKGGGINGGSLERRGFASAKKALDVWNPTVDLEASGLGFFLLPALVGLDGLAFHPDYPDISCHCRPPSGSGGAPCVVERAVCRLVALVFVGEFRDGWITVGYCIVAGS